jgi:tetratricopeptide (TPR) repeat protein
VVWGAGDLLARISAPATRKALGAVAFCILAALAVDTRKQLAYWHDGIVLFSRAVAVTDDNYIAHSKLAEALEAGGRLDEALLEFQTYVARHPDDASGNYNLAAALLRRGRTQEAIHGLEHTLTLTHASSVLAHTHYQLGNVFFNQGDMPSAELHYRKAVELNPREYGADMMLGLILEHSGKHEQAIVYLQKSVEMDTPDSAYFYLGEAYENGGRLSDALAAYQQALKIAPAAEQIQSAAAAAERKLRQH